MEVRRRTASPDFAAGEAQFFRALRAAFSDIQAQCENEKVSNQRSFERNQQAIQQRIHDLEFKCSDLARRKRELEDAEREAALELQKKRYEEIQDQKAHHELEERRRRKFSALLRGDSATNLRIVLTPRLHQDHHQSPAAKTGQLSDSGPGLLQSRNGQEIIGDVPSLGDGQYSSAGGLDTRMANEARHHFVELESNAALSPARNSAEERVSHEKSLGAVQEIIVADENHQTDQCSQIPDTTEVRQGKRKRFPTAKAQALGLGGDQSDHTITGSNKRRALTPRQAEPSPNNWMERQQDWTPERQPQPSKPSVIETARHFNNEGARAQNELLSEVFAHHSRSWKRLDQVLFRKGNPRTSSRAGVPQLQEEEEEMRQAETTLWKLPELTRKTSTKLAKSFQRELANASRGFVAPLVPGVIKDTAGKTVWDIDSYKFLSSDAKCPPTVNEKLWRQGRLTAKQGLFEVVPGIYQLRSLDISNMTIVEGESGIIVVDPLVSCEPAAAGLELYRKHRDPERRRKVDGLVYTHSHTDHFGGAGGILERTEAEAGAAGVPIIAPRGFMEAVMSENLIAGPSMHKRSVYMYGMALPKGPKGHVGSGLGIASSTGTRSLIPPTTHVEKTGD
ncbi:hypothetical protein FJTKL_03992 [Diaporthe vaccinii]|uniref:Metallo-beta-lactamase domain-containing protein n=1 Tax=Diaporthe vaccinii TaxID=105482 RepID=A0ABR4DU53_9PEZI